MAVKDVIKTESKGLNPRQALFCALYVSSDREFFGNGVQSYIEVYKPDQMKKGWYQRCCVDASKLLSNPKIIDEINKLLEIEGLNDVAVDKQLAFIITQHADFGSKVAAIREYNKLKARIVARQDITSGGKPIPIINVHRDDRDAEDSQAE